jgi:hypothetical protein
MMSFFKEKGYILPKLILLLELENMYKRQTRIWGKNHFQKVKIDGMDPLFRPKKHPHIEKLQSLLNQSDLETFILIVEMAAEKLSVSHVFSFSSTCFFSYSSKSTTLL